MAWSKPLTVMQVVTRLIQVLSLYNLCNRSYDGYVVEGASSVRRPKLALLTAKKNEGTAADGVGRTATGAGTTMVETDLDTYAVPILAEIAAKWSSNDKLRQEYIVSAVLTLQKEFDKAVIAAAQATDQVFNFAADVMSWKDITKISAVMNQNEVPKDGRVVVISANLEQEFWDIDAIKNAASYNMQLLSSGKMIEVLGMKFFISGNVPQVGGKDNIVGFYGQGLAFILSKFGEIKEVYSPDLLADVIDLLAYAGCELDDNKFAVVIKKQ